MEETSQNFLYETLSPLALSSANQSPPPDDLEPFTVFRNEISLSSLPSASPATTTQDFFSLDVGADGSDSVPASPAPPRQAAEPKTPAREAEPRLESGWFRGNSKFKSPMLQLHKEIVDFCEFLSPTPEEQDARNAAIERVFDVIKYIWPNCKVEVFGSFKTGLYLPSSDIDVVILGAGIPNPQQGLQALSRALSQRSLVKKMQVIAKARVPIIKFVEKKSGVAFDISFDVQNGPVAAEFIKDVVSKMPPLRPLCLILKVFLQQRELNESLREPEGNLGVILVNFFDFYGRKLNTSDVGVSCNGGGTFFSKISKGFATPGRPFLISIQDPQASENDIGKNSFNYFQIRSAFSMAFTTLTNPRIIMDLGPNRSILGTIIRPDAVLLERKGGSNRQVTFDSLLPGAGEPLNTQYGQQEMLCNWQLDDEEPLPRGGDLAGDPSEYSSGKKRRASAKEKSGKKKVKDNGDVGSARHRENGYNGDVGSSRHRENGYGSRKEKIKEKRFRHSHGNANGYGRSVSPWSR
ncbi:PAP-associated domain-containing protein 5 [Morus notabilis]|uniref:polynucleotide adenylyltransferase n=1 Tax=Morus notabilis TaxID=981085 RepID=W9RD67_9ROSA|nr:PAP-associated domain-containing protein 5 [Morus notabilis]